MRHNQRDRRSFHRRRNDVHRNLQLNSDLPRARLRSRRTGELARKVALAWRARVRRECAEGTTAAPRIRGDERRREVIIGTASIRVKWRT